MAAVISPPLDDEDLILEEWSVYVIHVESYGCGEADEPAQGIQPLEVTGE